MDSNSFALLDLDAAAMLRATPPFFNVLLPREHVVDRLRVEES
jgi:hypothetical protein